MDETISLIIHGCQLAKDLESNLPNLANQPNFLSKSCDEIIKIFINARERLISAQDHQTSYHPHMFFPEPQQSQPSQIHTGVQEWLRSSYTQAMDIVFQTQVLTGKGAYNVPGLPESKPELGLEVPATELGGRDMEGSARFRGSIGGEFQAVGASDSSRNSSSQRSRRRKDEADKRTVRVAAPRIGNTEIPPEDGFTWRKYGQKEILGSRFPRGYYRCTHQKLYQCAAKKQVQRLDNDPSTFEVTYRGTHTCHMSSTAPSVAPQEMNETTTTTQPPPSATSVPLGTWLSMEIRPNTFMDSHVQMYRNISLSGAGGSSGSMVGSDGAGPSTVRGREAPDYHLPVVDMADVMFNSGSSSNNSMDFIFPTMEDKWEPEDKKN